MSSNKNFLILYSLGPEKNISSGFNGLCFQVKFLLVINSRIPQIKILLTVNCRSPQIKILLIVNGRSLQIFSKH